jgi:nickel-dependent lactate racemase
MDVKLAYGKTGLEISLPEGADVTVVSPRFVDALPDPAGVLRAGLQNPISAPPLRDFVKSSDRVGIVFSDITRATPYHLLLPAILGELAHVPDKHITLFNATGTHRPNTDAELRGMLGETIVERFQIVQNDANDRVSHVQVGTTARGNAVWLHRDFVACDVHILTGFIEPHFFAGFSGGPKATMPGVALLDTIMANHSAANLDDPNVRWGITHGNPLWDEINEAAHMIPRNFLVNVALNSDKQIAGVFAGDLDRAHAQGCAFVKETAMAPVDRRFDLVIGSNSGYPLDLNLYQSVKGMSAAAQVVKPGGAILIAADCWDGIPAGSPYEHLLHSRTSSRELLTMLQAPGFQCQDMWQAYIQAKISQSADVYVYSRNLTPAQIEGALLKPCERIEALVGDVIARTDASICVLPEGPLTIPYVT